MLVARRQGFEEFMGLIEIPNAYQLLHAVGVGKQAIAAARDETSSQTQSHAGYGGNPQPP
jgi:hypothetical protein